MTQGPSGWPQVTPQLLTPSQLMGAERAHRKAGLQGCSIAISVFRADLQETPRTPRDPHPPQPRPGHVHISYPVTPSIQGWTQALSQRGEMLSADICWDSLVTWRACFPGAGSCRMPAHSVTAPAQVRGDGLCAETGGVASGCCPRTLCLGPCQL